MKTTNSESKKSNNVVIFDFSQPLTAAKTANFKINVGTGNLTVDNLENNQPILANGTLEYVEKQGPPKQLTTQENGCVTLDLSSNNPGRPTFRLPWEACNGETEWLIHLNPEIQSDINTHSDGGNIKLHLGSTNISNVTADTGGGNIELELPRKVSNLNVDVKTGAGNVTVAIGNGTTGRNVINANSGAGNVEINLPNGLDARIQAKSGLGKVILDPRVIKLDGNLYQTPDFDNAKNKVEISLSSGAGNAVVTYAS